MSRVVLVPPNASLLTDPSTEHLHTYLSGEMLVRTNARTNESEAALETPVESGVRLGSGRALKPSEIVPSLTFCRRRMASPTWNL